jgi:hypothetical protein
MTTPSPNRPHNKHRRHQRGAALLILMLLVMLGLITLFTFRMDRKGPDLNANRQTALALVQAKEALLGNSVTNGIASTSLQNPGRLPCPNIDNSPANEGKATALAPPLLTACRSAAPGNTANLGRFPWKTLNVDDLRDGAAERLWYVVDPNFVDTGAPMNSGITPTLTVNSNQVVAVIIAPGPALGALNQLRDTANQNDYRNYLESYINTTSVALNPQSITYNDHIITITARELFNVVTQRMVREFVKKLEENGLDSPYYPTSYPVMARRPITNSPLSPPTPPDTWFDNQWDGVASTGYSATPLHPTQFTLLLTSCSSAFTVTRNTTSNIISGKCY